MFGRLLTGSAVGLFFVVVVVTVAALQEREVPQTGILAGRTPQPTPTEAVIPFTTPKAVPLTRGAGSQPGYDGIASLEGGWSLEIPATWTAASASMRGADIASFDVRSASLDGNAPAADQLRMRVQLMTDYDLTPLETFGARDVPHWLLVGQTHTTVSGREAVRTVKNAYVPAGSPFDQQHVVWNFRTPFLADRIVAVDAWPANGLLAVEAEHAMATFALFAPPPAPTNPKVSRSTAMARAAEHAGAFGTAGASIAKLVLFQDYDKAQIAEAKRSGGPYSVGGPTDPDQLVWIVVVKGDFEQLKGGGPPGIGVTPAPPPRLVWLTVIVNATEGSVVNYVTGSHGDAPPWFDALADRAH
jgi:hypothetical protein